jgi:tetratricopeptide (TPR) repeat protein
MAGLNPIAEARRKAEALTQVGQIDRAIAVLRNAAEESPADPAGWRGLAEALAGANRPDLAVVAWRTALGLDPNSAPTLIGEGRALYALGRAADAGAAFERALKLAPTLVEARYGLALLAFDRGDYDEAATQVQALPATPAVAWLNARTAGARGAWDLARTILDELMATPGLAIHLRAEALLLLAQALDRLGRPSEAFPNAMEGKAIQHRLFAPRAAGREGETAKLERLAAWFAAAEPRDWISAPLTAGASGHLFLVGFPRSGTTLLEQALAAHPSVIALEEAPTLADAYQEFLTTAEGLERLARIDAAEAARWRAHYWRTVRAHGAEPADRVFLDKAPAGTLNLPLVAKLFPDAKVLFAVRDPRAVVLSCAMSAFQMNATTYAFTSLAETARCYAASMALADTYRRVLPLAWQEVRYENLVADLATELTGVCAFAGLQFDPAMVDIATAARGRVVRTPSAVDVREGLSRRGLDRWRAYEYELAPVMATLAPWIERFGYTVGNSAA